MLGPGSLFVKIQGLGYLFVLLIGAGALPSYFTQGAGALHAKINKTHPTAGALILYLPSLNIIVAGALFIKKVNEPGQGPGGPGLL